MNWDSFIWFAMAASLFWISGAVASLKAKRLVLPLLLTGIGIKIFLTFIFGIWVTLGYPPLRTMGETRLWFSVFLSLIGCVVYLRWRYRWILPFSCLMSVVFVCINVFKPEIHTEELMPALRSPWFVPHVIVYMFAYAVMGVASILAVRILWLFRKSVLDRIPTIVCSDSSATKSANETISAHPLSIQSDIETADRLRTLETDLRLCDILVRIGWGFLTMGIVMGALWAKQAWGDYWTWDPKEVWAAATWLSYLLYLHLRQGQGSVLSSGMSADSSAHSSVKSLRCHLFLLILSFVLLQMCWWGVNYLPSAQGFSLHTY